MRSRMLSTALFGGLLALLAPFGQGQEVIVQQHQVVPTPAPSLYGFKCANVLCDGAMEYVIMKIPAGDSFCSYCPDPNGFCTVIPLKPAQQWICDVADPTPPPPPPPVQGQMKYSPSAVAPSVSSNGLWTVKVFVCYCNGDIPLIFEVSDVSYCSIIQRVRREHCQNYDPCNPSYLKFCVVKRPNCQPVCSPGR